MNMGALAPKTELQPAGRRLLLISYDFPPRRTSAVYRVTNLTKHLVRYGWQPTVLTVQGSRGDPEDPLLLEGFPPQIRVERTRSLEISGWEGIAGVGVRALGGLRPLEEDRQQPPWDRWIRAAGRFVRSCLYFPDDTVGWVPLGLAKAIELHLQSRFDAVYTTSPPRAGPVIGLLLKSLLGVPWAAEFRDPWYPPSKPWRRTLERRLLQRVLDRADRIIVISEGNANDFDQSYGIPRCKVAVVSNGYDENDFAALDGKRSPLLEERYLHLSHFGTVYPNFSGQFFDALLDLVTECPDLRNHLRVNIIGFPDDAVQHYAARSDLRDLIRLNGFVKHQEAIAAMASSDCLLLFLGSRDVARLSGLGKIYDYLRVGRPILAVAYEGGAQKLIEEGKAGWVVDPEDREGIKAALRAIVQRGKRTENPHPARPQFVEQFRFDRVAGKLAAVLDSMVSCGRQA